MIHAPDGFIVSSGFILDKTIAVNSPKRMENARILIANTCTTFTIIPSQGPYASLQPWILTRLKYSVQESKWTQQENLLNSNEQNG